MFKGCEGLSSVSDDSGVGGSEAGVLLADGLYSSGPFLNGGGSGIRPRIHR